MVPLSDPLGHSVRLPDLRPYTVYNLSLRERVVAAQQRQRNNGSSSSSSSGKNDLAKERLVAALNFSTAG